MVNKLVEPTPGNEIAMSEGQFRLYGCDSGLLVTSIYKDQNETIEDIFDYMDTNHYIEIVADKNMYLIENYIFSNSKNFSES